jgi:hypothetical protein
MTPRVAALMFAVLLAAPSVAAAPAPASPSRSPLVAAPAKSAWVSTNRAVPKPTVHRRGRIDPMTLPKVTRPTSVNQSRPKLSLPFPAAAAGPQVGGPLVATPIASINPTSATHPPIAGTALPGLNRVQFSATDVEPPDAFVAVGPEHVVQTVNSAIRIQHRQGETLVDQPLTDFFGIDPSTRSSDARVIYDSLHGRWFVIQVEWDCIGDASKTFGQGKFGHGYLDVRLSDTADPTKGSLGWVLQFNDYLPDYPGLGTSTDKIALSSNIFKFENSFCDNTTFGEYQGNEMDFLDWGEIIRGGDKDGNLTLATLLNVGPTIFATRPAVQAPATSSAIFAVNVTANGSNADVGWVNFTGSVLADTVVAAGAGDLTISSGLPAFGNPHPPVQPGGVVTSVDGIDGRATDAVWQGNRLVFTATTDCVPPPGPTAQDCVRVTELATSSPGSTPTVTQDFNLGAAGEDFYFGGIGLALNGSLHVTYTRSNASTVFPSGYAVYQLPTDLANSVSTAQEVLHGDPVKYTGTRWGDYMGVATDPQAPGTAWRTNQASDSAGEWKTNIGALNTDFGSTYVPIDPVRVLDTRIALGLSGRFQSNVARSFQITTPATSIPLNAVAITGNVTEVSQTAVGFVAVTPRPTNKPTSATVNFPVGDARNNNVTTALGPGGTIAATYVAASGKFTHLVFDVTGYFMPNNTGATFKTTPMPARILDSRDGTGLAGHVPGKFKRAEPRSFPVWNQGGVPATAIAVTGNLTVTNQNSAGDIALGPVSPADPFNPGTSNLNYIRGDNRGNGVSVKLGPAGELFAVVHSSTANASADLVFDVTGYYLAGGTGFKYYPLNPGRIMDTRSGVVLSGLSGAFLGSAGTTNTRTLDTDGHWGIPLDAKAITGNLAVTAPTKAGHITIMLSTSDPQTASLNFPAGDTRSNGITVSVTDPAGSPSGDLLMHYHTSGGGTVHLILDATGYFK